MEFEIHVHINNQEVLSSDLPNYELACKGIDRIFNEIVRRKSHVDDRKVEELAS